MNVYTIHFSGHYPVGACAVIVAETEQKALNAIHRELKKKGLEQKLSKEDLELLDTGKAEVRILLDGNY